jgi:O-antigen ligase
LPEHLKALLVILLLAAGMFAFARAPACAAGTPVRDFNLRRNTWFAVTLIAFLAHSFWIYVAAAAVVLLVAAARDENRLALFFSVLFAVPAMPMEIPGVAGIRYLFDIHHVRLLALAVLLPAFLSLATKPDTERFGRRWADWLLLAYLGLYFVLTLLASSATNALRQGLFYGFIDIFLPYYVASRSLRSIADFRDALGAFVVAALVLAAVGIVESAKGWLLYFSLQDALRVPWNYGEYLPRDGFVRALGTAGQPIAYGYVIAVAIGFFVYLRRFLSPLATAAGFAVLLAALAASISRGPWLGAALILLLGLTTGRSAGVRLLAAGLIAVGIVPFLFSTTIGARLMDFLPFVGTVDAENLTYRARLLDTFLTLMAERPLFGSYDYMLTPEVQELRTGQGIIDVVNTYVGIGFASGLAGLSIFVGFFLSVGVGLLRAARLCRHDADVYLLGQALLATLLAILVMISAVSSITVIPVVYWVVAGLGVAYARLVESTQARVALEPARARAHPRARPLPAAR